ncbi:MAG: hypothetical protein HY826_11955 [Actinobacteria bacterium]|nr:hypothetical protein [Actinomycetota bacterium]
MGGRVVRGGRGWIFLAGLEVLMVGCIFTGSFAVFSQPSTDSKALEPDGALDDVTYAVPQWLQSVGLVLVATGIVIALLAWFASPPWYDGIQIAKYSARAEIAVLVISGAFALASGVVAVAVSWGASPLARTFGTIAIVVLSLALVASPLWVPWTRRKMFGDA